MCVKEVVIVRATNCSPIKALLALDHGSNNLVVIDDKKYQVHAEILIYHLLLLVRSPFDNHVSILLICRHNSDSIINTRDFFEILV